MSSATAIAPLLLCKSPNQGASSLNIFIGMETSGALRTRFQAQGHTVISVDKLEAEDCANGVLRFGGHIQGDVFETFAALTVSGWQFDVGVFHPDCTYMTNSAAWAFKDPDYERYPLGYHQQVKPGTLVGAARRAARELALQGVRDILALPIKRKAIENPIGAITKVRPFTQIVQPYQFGDNASKATGLILENLPRLAIDPKAYRTPNRLICQNCKAWNHYGTTKCVECGDEKFLPRWGNQTDSGQNCLSPGADRWKWRSRTFPGVAKAMVAAWGDEVLLQQAA